MAKKRRAKKTGTPAENVKPSEVTRRMTPGTEVKRLLNLKKRGKRQTWEINSEIGKEIAAAVDKKYLNRKAFAVIDKMWLMEAEELRNHWDTVLYYFEATGLLELYESAPALLPVTEDEVDDEEDRENVSSFPMPDRRSAAE
jgi:hypothetical protein